MESKDKLPGGVTKAQIDAWKKAHGVIHKISVIVEKDAKGKAKDVAVGYIKDVNDDLDIISNAVTLQATRVLEAKLFVLENAWLGGDERIRTVTKIKISAAIQAGQTVDLLDGSVEKL